MGELISLQQRRAVRDARDDRDALDDGFVAPVLCFDPGSVWTYLAAERAESRFAGLRWVPVIGAETTPLDHAAVERRARELRMPLIWPERPVAGRAPARVAQLAVERGCVATFVLALGRLTFCGGYDADDPRTLSEAGAVAGLSLGETLQAAGDAGRDDALIAGGLGLPSAAGLPALSLGGRLFCGEHRLPEAAAAYADVRRSERSRIVPTRGSR